jgi:hypothetical protein
MTWPSDDSVRSDLAIHPMAGIFGEADALLSMTTHHISAFAEICIFDGQVGNTRLG